MANTFIFDDEDQPDTGAPMPDQGDDDQAPEEEEGEGNNRIFILLLIGIGGFALVAILCIIGYFALSRPGGLLARVDPAATNEASTQQALVIQQTQDALQFTATLPAPLETETPTPTSVVVIFATETPLKEEPTTDPVTATFEALQTQLVKAQAAATTAAAKTTTPAAGAATATRTPQIPKTGFADEVGLPSLVIVTIILLGIILLARRLRAVPGR